jgi:hypothetical protein
MATQSDEYSVRARMYRLLVAFPKQGADFDAAVDQAMQEPDLRDIVSSLVGVAFGSYILKEGGDFRAAVELVNREHRAAEDLDSLGDSQ